MDITAQNIILTVFMAYLFLMSVDRKGNAYIKRTQWLHTVCLVLMSTQLIQNELTVFELSVPDL